MSHHPLNLGFRFLLELMLLAALAVWGWSQPGVWRWVGVVLAPLGAAALWGVFRVPGDGGDPVVQVPGPVRLLLELVLFGLAVGALAAAGRPTLALTLGVAVVFHYAISTDRIGWLLQR